jgi:hypothetical protein
MGYYLTSTPTSVTFHVSVISGRTYYRLFIRLSSETQVLQTINLPNQTRDFTYTVSGLTPGTSYTCNVGHFVDDPTLGGMIYMGGQSITTQTYPSFSFPDVTHNSITWKVEPGLGYEYYSLVLEHTASGEIVSRYEVDGATSTFYHTSYGLLPSTRYTPRIYYGESKSTGTSASTTAPPITTDAEPYVPPVVPTRPLNWSWQNISAGVSVPKRGEALAPTTASEWNSFCSRINAFRQYKDMSNYSFTSLTSGTAFSAAIARQAMTAISEISGHGTLPDKIEPLKAAFWLSLASSLNAVS